MLADRDTNTQTNRIITTLRSTTEVGVEILTRQSVCMIVGFFVICCRMERVLSMDIAAICITTATQVSVAEDDLSVLLQ